jgi:hypothetical protein
MNGIGSAIRRGVPVGCLAVTLIAGTAAACSGGGGSGGNSAASSPSAGDTGAGASPRTEGTGPESPGATASGVAVSLPSLPIGGAAAPVAQQCLGISWNGTSLIEGATVVVTGVAISPSGVFEAQSSGSSCGGKDCGASFVFRPGQTDCVVGLKATASQGRTATLTLSGSARCTTDQQAWCQSLSGSSAQGIPLTQPGSPDQTSSESPPSSSESSSSESPPSTSSS